MRAWTRLFTVAAAATLTLAPLGPGSPARAATDHPISIAPDQVFSPPELAVAVGDSVTWSNASSEDHNVRGGPFSSPRMPPNGTFSHTFTRAGKISYVCDFHPNMKGRITVG